MIYFDTAASYPLLPEVSKALSDAFKTLYANSSSNHLAGIEVLTKMFLYYWHERVWSNISWEKKSKEEHTTIFPFNDKEE